MKFWAVLALAACVAALPLEAPPPLEGVSLHKREEALTHIGYRVMSQYEASLVKENGNIAIESNKSGGTQLGYGIYLTSDFREYNPADPNKKDQILWDCAAFVDPHEWATLNKAWINQWYNFGAEDDQCKWGKVWSNLPQSRENRKDFMPLVKEGFTLENTVRFSQIVSHESVEQMVIPNEIIARGILTLKYCSQRGEDGGETTKIFGRASWNTAKLPGFNMGQYQNPKRKT